MKPDQSFIETYHDDYLAWDEYKKRFSIAENSYKENNIGDLWKAYQETTKFLGETACCFIRLNGMVYRDGNSGGSESQKAIASLERIASEAIQLAKMIIEKETKSKKTS